MDLTPLDIKQRIFKRAMRGYDSREVDEFLALVVEQMEEILRDANDTKEKLALKEAQIAEHVEREKALKETLVTAQKMAEDVKSMAEREAKVIISNAELEAERILQDSMRRREDLAHDLLDLKRQKVQFETTLRGSIEMHLKMLDALSEHDAKAPEPPDLSFLKHMPNPAVNDGTIDAGARKDDTPDGDTPDES